VNTRRIVGWLRRAAPEIVLGLVIVLVAISLWQAWALMNHLREEARQASQIYARVIPALADPDPGAATETIFALVAEIRATGIPLVVTDTAGRPTAVANLPTAVRPDEAVLRDIIHDLDRANDPIVVPGVGVLHFGAVPAARRLARLTIIQFAVLAAALAIGIWAYRSAVSRHRDRLWVAMARESAHQLGTPLMSAGAWVDRLTDGTSPPPQIAAHLRADLERLHRVAQRFERIGRPARRDHIALGAMAERVAGYFEPRLPRRSHPIKLCVDAPRAGPMIRGDAVLVEWALEALVRNAVDALSGRGGKIDLTVWDEGNFARVKVADDGPGIPADVRATLFEPGVSTKSGGWGIGLALAQRIVEDVHRGRLGIEQTSEGAVFVADLPVSAVGPDDD
jgi:signal transduction histidine kinase